MMDAFDKLVEKHFPKNPLQTLMEMVEEQLDGFDPKKFLREAKEEARDCEQVDERYLPPLVLTELGLMIKTPGEGQARDIEDTPQARQELEAWLAMIAPDQGLMAKVKNLSDFFKNPTAFLEQEGGSNINKIVRGMSFLHFYKTLTGVITNFNASSAGFTFEAFLATLLRGTQIPAAGADTIGDIIDAGGEKFSLKLYDLQGAKAGGSWKQLVDDLVRDGVMKYVVVTKNLTEGATPLETQGTLEWFQWNFTLNNVFNIMSEMGSKAGTKKREFIWLPRNFVENMSEFETTSHWARAGELELKGEEGLEGVFYKQASTLLLRKGQRNATARALGFPTPEGVQKLLDELDWTNEAHHTSGGPGQSKSMAAGPVKAIIARVLEANPDDFPGYANADEPVQGRGAKPPTKKEIVGSTRAGILGVLNIANKDITDKNMSAAETSRRAQKVLRPSGFWLNTEQSLAWYNDPARTDDEKRAALQNCKGSLMYRHGGGHAWKQFELNFNNIQDVATLAAGTVTDPETGQVVTGPPSEGLFDPGQESVQFMGAPPVEGGDPEPLKIEIGAQSIQDLLDKTGGLVNNNLGQIWCNLDVLTRGLQTWFTSGLADEKSSTKVKVAAKNIEKKTAAVEKGKI